MYDKWVSIRVNLKQVESSRVRKSQAGSRSGALGALGYRRPTSAI